MLTAKLNACAVQRNTAFEGASFGELDSKEAASHPVSEEDVQRRSSVASIASVTLHATASGDIPADAGAASGHANPLPDTGAASREEDDPQARRQRRRVEDSSVAVSHAGSPAATSVSGRSQSPHYACPPPHPALLSKRSETSLRARASQSMSPGLGEDMHDDSGEEDDGSGEDEMALAVGQLSINEDEQVRYHGKASGLHLLGASERHDGRSEGGIWYVYNAHFGFNLVSISLADWGKFRRFPKARVWPPLPPTQRTPTKTEDDWLSRLPPQDVQEHLLELYFTYVHTQLPILHKKTFMELYRNG